MTNLELPVSEIHTQQVALENCTDPTIPDHLLDLLQEHDIKIYKGVAAIGGTTVRFTQLINMTATEPGVVISGGYCAPEGGQRYLAVYTALLGRNVSYIKPPRAQSLCATLNRGHLNDVLKLQQQAIWAASRDMMQRTDMDKIDVYGHSMGGVVATGVATHKPGKVRNLILAGSAGIDGKNTFRDRAKRLPNVIRHDIIGGIGDIRNSSGNGMALEAGAHILKRFDRTAREGITVARADIRGQIDRVQDCGTKVGVILFGDDGFFKVEDVKAANYDRIFNAFEVIPNVTHVFPQQEPKEHSYDIDNMLSDLQSADERLIA